MTRSELARRVLITAGIPWAGLVMLFIGVAYDTLFAGVPAQDPTPEITARYDFHHGVAVALYLVGGIVLILGLFLIPVVWVRTKQADH